MASDLLVKSENGLCPSLLGSDGLGRRVDTQVDTVMSTHKKPDPPDEAADFELAGWRPIRRRPSAESRSRYARGRDVQISGFPAIDLLVQAAKDLKRQGLLQIWNGRAYAMVPCGKRLPDGRWQRLNSPMLHWRLRG